MSDISTNNSNLAFLKRLFNCSFLIFRDNDAKISKWRLILAGLIMLIAIFELSSLFYYIMRWRHEITSKDFMIFSWTFQAFVSICLILRWQFGPFQRIFDMNTWTQFGYAIFSTTEIRKRLIRIYVTSGIFSAATIFRKFHQIVTYWMKYIQNEKLARNIHEGYGGQFLTGLGQIFDVYLLYIWIIVFLFYILILNVFCEALRHFNRELKCFGQNDDKMDDRIKKLSKIYDKQVNLIALLQEMNSTFEIFSCLNLGPITIILIASLYDFFKIVMSGSLSDALSTLFVISLYLSFLIEIVGPSSQINSEAKEMEKNAILNKNIWASLDDKLYQLGSMIVMNARQDNLGITLWGFALITKSMLLTIASVTITYLTIVLQMNSEVKIA